LSFFNEIRDFYDDQLELINSIEDILLPKTEQTEDNRTAYQKRHIRIVKILTMVTLIANIVCLIVSLYSLLLTVICSLLKILLIIKVAAAVVSKSLSVISSVVDSTVDLLTSLMLLWTARKMKKHDVYKYPGGDF